MASFLSIPNQSFYQKQMIEKAFQNLLEESMLYECPSIIKKFSSSSDLNLSSVRADLFTSMKMNKNTKKWRKELKRKKSKAVERMNQSEQVGDSKFNLPGFSQHQESHISTLDDKIPKMSQSSSQPFLWKPHLAAGAQGKKYSDSEFLKPKSPPKKKGMNNKVRTVSVGTSQVMGPPTNFRTAKIKRKASNQEVDEEEIRPLKPCSVVVEKIPTEYKRKAVGHKRKSDELKNEHWKDIYDNNKKYIFDQWIFKIDENDDVFIKGHLSGSPANMFWSTSEILKRINSKVLLTGSGKLCILEGAIMKKPLISKGYPAKLIDKFTDGFPQDWKNILRSVRVPKVAAEKKEPRHQTIKKEIMKIQEENEEEEQQDDDEEESEELEEESQEDDVPQTEKLSANKESSETATVEKKKEIRCDYLFDILSHNTSSDRIEADPRPSLETVRKRSSSAVENTGKTDTDNLNKNFPSQVTQTYMTRSLASKLKDKPNSLKESQKNLKIIPKELKSKVKTATKKIAEEFNSPHPLSNTINMDSAESSKKKVSNSGKKNVDSKTTPPAKPTQVKKPQTLKNLKNKKQPACRQKTTQQKSQKPSVAKKRTSKTPEPRSPKKTVTKEKKKDLGGKMIKDWTDEEVQKLLTAMSRVPKTAANFWKKVANFVGRSPEECTNYYCSCDLSNLDWKDLKKEKKKEERPIVKKKNLHIYDVSDSYEDDLFECESFFGHSKKIRLNQDCHLDNIFADLSVKTPSSSDQNFQTPMSKFFLTPVSECQTPASTFSDGDIKIDWDNADRCVKEFKKKQKKGAGRLKMNKRLAEIKSELKPKTLQLGSLVDELNKINNIPKKSYKEDETEDSYQNHYFSSESED